MIVTVILVCLCVQEAKPQAAPTDLDAIQQQSPSQVVPADKSARPVQDSVPAKAQEQGSGKEAAGDDVKKARSVLNLSGRVEASEQASLYSRVTGVVQKVHVDIGDRVTAGQMLVELFAPDLRSELSKAQAGVQQARAQVDVAQAVKKVAQSALAAVRAQL